MKNKLHTIVQVICVLITVVCCTSAVGVYIQSRKVAELPDRIKASADSLEYVYDRNLTGYNDPQYSMIDVPEGIAIGENRLVVTDSENDCLYAFDFLDGAFDVHGRTGNDNGQFIYPTSITYQNGRYYILDAKNFRIQIFDDDFEYLSQIELPRKDMINMGELNPRYCDIDIIDDCIYVSSTSVSAESAKVLKIKNEVINEIIDNFIGYIDTDGENVYAINSKDLLNTKEHIYIYNGKPKIYCCSNEKVQIVGELPNGYEPGDFVVHDEYIYILNNSNHSLDKFNLQGEYVESIYKFDDESLLKYITYDDEGKIFYITMSSGIILLDNET